MVRKCGWTVCTMGRALAFHIAKPGFNSQNPIWSSEPIWSDSQVRESGESHCVWPPNKQRWSESFDIFPHGLLIWQICSKTEMEKAVILRLKCNYIYMLFLLYYICQGKSHKSIIYLPILLQRSIKPVINHWVPL